MNDGQSEYEQSTDVSIKIENCLLKALKSAQPLLEAQVTAKIRRKINDINRAIHRITDPIQFFIFSLLNRVSEIEQMNSITIEKEDYENLENAVQKSEAEIRKHIRLEQQLKIYMDDLEEKVQQLEKQLKIQELKYMQLYDSMKALNDERKDLEKKIKVLQVKGRSTDKDKNIISHKVSKIMSDASLYESQTNAYKAYDKNRATKNSFLMGKKLSKKSEDSKSKLLHGNINVSLGQSPSKKKMITDNTEIRQITRTIQLKEAYRKPSRKLMKHMNEHKSSKKEGRCNSVCY